jgi:hypothetical protein
VVDPTPCQWISARDAFKGFATHVGGTQSAKHIKPLHWYIACRLVLQGGFHPDDVKPRPPFGVTLRRRRAFLSFNPDLAGAGEQVILGGLKTKNVDVVVTKPGIGPVIAVSCKGVTKAFRNLTNRMEETIGECTNLHITYPAMVLGYFALMRANRTVQDALEAPTLDPEEDASAQEEPPAEAVVVEPVPRNVTTIAANDIAILPNGAPVEGIIRFHAALREMTSRRGVRNEISRYEAMALALIEPKGAHAGAVLSMFPPSDSPLQLDRFFDTLYQRYEERFVYGAPLLADRGITPRMEWSPESSVFRREEPGSEDWPELDFVPRLASQ